MYYGNIVYDDGYVWKELLANSPVPVVMGISVWDGVFNDDTCTYDITFNQQLAKINTFSKSNLAGYSIWVYDEMSYEDMEIWRAWIN